MSGGGGRLDPGRGPPRRGGRPLGALLLALLVPAPATAQERPLPYGPVGWSDAAILAGALALTGAGGLLVRARAHPTDDELARDGSVTGLEGWATRQASMRWDRASDRMRDGLILAAGASFALLNVRSSGPDRLETLGTMGAELALLTLGTALTLKGAVGRPRPFTYNGGLSLAAKRRMHEESGALLSFPSGHAAIAFASAVVASTLFQDAWTGPAWAERAVWGATLTTASLTAYARVAAGKHFPTDVATGALLGSSLGWLVPYRYRER